MAKLLVFIEQRDTEIKKSSYEACKAGADLAADLNIDAEAVAVGNEINGLETIGNYGIKKVVHFKNSELANYSSSAYTDVLTQFAKESDADYIIAANTSMGKDLAPRVGVHLDAGSAVDCIALNVMDGEVIASRPVYAGKAIIDIKVTSPKKVFTVRPNIFRASELLSESAQVEVKDVSSPNLNSKVINYSKSEGKLDVAEADIIVSGGRGVKEAANFNLIEDLADVLGGAVGASRAVVDAGWRPHSEQVGQTGKTVSPTLYVAAGISGAIQHLAGMRSSKYIVAINKDPDAPIFQITDYGITGDLFEVLPVLTEEIKKAKNG